MKNEELSVPKDLLIKKMIDRGIPVWKADFVTEINNAGEIPESMFSKKSNKESKHVTMWWVPGDGLLCFQYGIYFMVPADVVKCAKFTNGGE